VRAASFLPGSLAPLVPSLAKRRLELRGLAGVVEKRAIRDIFTKAVAEGFPKSSIFGQRYGFFYVGFDIFRSPIRMADRGEQRKADPRSVAIAGEGDHGRTHPESLAGRRGAVVGEGVKRHIDSGVGREMVARAIEKAEEFDSVAGNSSGGEFFADAGLHIGVIQIGAFDQEPRVGNLVSLVTFKKLLNEPKVIGALASGIKGSGALAGGS